MGTNPNMHSEMYRRVNTLEVCFKREESKIEAKKMALILVGVPKNTLF